MNVRALTKQHRDQGAPASEKTEEGVKTARYVVSETSLLVQSEGMDICMRRESQAEQNRAKIKSKL